MTDFVLNFKQNLSLNLPKLKLPQMILDFDFINQKNLVLHLQEILETENISKFIVFLPKENGDARIAAIITALMKLERLDIPLVPIYFNKTLGTKKYNINTWNIDFKLDELNLTLQKSTKSFPLIRDEYGYAIFASASQIPLGEVKGESYVDNHQLFSGIMPKIEIQVQTKLPGLKARVPSGLKKFFWHEGRAIQTGSEKMNIIRDNIIDGKTKPKSTFYTFDKPFNLVI